MNPAPAVLTTPPQTTPPLPREAWLGAAGIIFGIHKSFAMANAFAVVLLVCYIHARAEPDPSLRGVAGVSLILVALQAAAGFGLASYALPPFLQVAHLVLGSLLLGALFVLCLLAYRLDPRESAEPELAPAH